jgi:hypothetical protein
MPSELGRRDGSGEPLSRPVAAVGGAAVPDDSPAPAVPDDDPDDSGDQETLL